MIGGGGGFHGSGWLAQGLRGPEHTPILPSLPMVRQVREVLHESEARARRQQALAVESAVVELKASWEEEKRLTEETARAAVKMAQTQTAEQLEGVLGELAELKAENTRLALDAQERLQDEVSVVVEQSFRNDEVTNARGTCALLLVATGRRYVALTTARRRRAFSNSLTHTTQHVTTGDAARRRFDDGGRHGAGRPVHITVAGGGSGGAAQCDAGTLEAGTPEAALEAGTLEASLLAGRAWGDADKVYGLVDCLVRRRRARVASLRRRLPSGDRFRAVRVRTTLAAAAATATAAGAAYEDQAGAVRGAAERIPPGERHGLSE